MPRPVAVRWNRETIRDAVRRQSFWMELLGAALIVLGCIALVAVIAASLISVILIGGLLLASGALYVAGTAAYWRVRSGGFALGILLGILCGIAGVLCMTRPAGSLIAITFVLGTYFLMTGVVRMAAALYHRLPGWGWASAVAVVDLLLGLVILAWWPVSSLVVPGTLLGVQLVASGVAAVTTGAAVRGALAPGPEEPRTGRPATRLQH
jgi:uncharacterized membrane protein HdeD (DUF308 family)